MSKIAVDFQIALKKTVTLLAVAFASLVFVGFSYALDVNVTDAPYNAQGNGSTDDTQAIKDAVAAVESSGGGGNVYFPSGTYKVTDTIRVSKSGVHLRGAGVYATYIKFEPTMNKTCMKFSAGASVLYHCSLKEISFTSSETIYSKTAIEIIDTSSFVLEDISVKGSYNANGSFFWHGASQSIGLVIRGRETGTIDRVKIYADRPIVIATNPNHSISIDHFTFRDTYLGAYGAPNVEIQNGVQLTNTKFVGSNAWVLGTYGLYWNDTTSTASSLGLVLSGVRTEQHENNANHWTVYINRANASLQQVSISDCIADLHCSGFYFRNVRDVSINNVIGPNSAVSTPSKSALNVDNTVNNLNLNNCRWGTNTIATLSGMRRIWSTPQTASNSPLPTNAIYMSDTVKNRALTLGGALAEASTPDVVNAGSYPIAEGAATGTLYVTDSAGNNAVFSLKGLGHNTQEVSDPWNAFSDVPGTANGTNVYWSSSTARYVIENKTGSSKKYKYTLLGSYTSW